MWHDRRPRRHTTRTTHTCYLIHATITTTTAPTSERTHRLCCCHHGIVQLHSAFVPRTGRGHGGMIRGGSRHTSCTIPLLVITQHRVRLPPRLMTPPVIIAVKLATSATAAVAVMVTAKVTVTVTAATTMPGAAPIHVPRHQRLLTQAQVRLLPCSVCCLQVSRRHTRHSAPQLPSRHRARHAPLRGALATHHGATTAPIVVAGGVGVAHAATAHMPASAARCCSCTTTGRGPWHG